MSANFSGVETARLSISPWGDECGLPAFQAALRRMLTPAVLEHLPPSMAFDQVDGDISAWIADRNARTQVYSIKLIETGDLLGLYFVFEDAEAQDGAHYVGYLLSEDSWGKGYASEASIAVVRALEGLRLRAGTSKDNIASQRVLLKAGFGVERETEDGVFFLKE